MARSRRFAICTSNDGHPASLERWKVYEVLADADAEREGLVRVVDESGEDYLYPARQFAPIELPRDVARAFPAH